MSVQQIACCFQTDVDVAYCSFRFLAGADEFESNCAQWLKVACFALQVHTIKSHFTGSHGHRFPTWTCWVTVAWKALGFSGLQDAMGLRVAKTQRKQDKVQKVQSNTTPPLVTHNILFFKVPVLPHHPKASKEPSASIFIAQHLGFAPTSFGMIDRPSFLVPLLWLRCWRSNGTMALDSRSVDLTSPWTLSQNPGNNLLIWCFLPLCCILLHHFDTLFARAPCYGHINPKKLKETLN